ncbi:MAG: phosphate acyltransferase PlsX [Thermodesulfobacteriota bacterium]
MRIALDAMGGDRGPEELIAGAVAAVADFDVTVHLFGDETRLTDLLRRHPVTDPDRIRIVHAAEVVGMDEAPFDAIRKKRDATIVRAFKAMAAGDIDAVVSAGNSGATMAAAVRYLGRLDNISRPGIAGIYPSLKGPVVMMDVGANVDCRPQHLFQFGVMAAAFAEVAFQISRPRIGLLSIGEEGGKGNILVKKAHDLFRRSNLNYIGNVEGRDTFSGDVDVIVCDGFVGNVCLKVSEGLAEAILTMLRDEIGKSIPAKIGYLLARGAFNRFRKRVDYAEYGGAPLLGLNGPGVICHGRSNGLAIKNAIRVAADLVRNKINHRIEAQLASYADIAGRAAAEEGAAVEADKLAGNGVLVE